MLGWIERAKVGRAAGVAEDCTGGAVQQNVGGHEDGVGEEAQPGLVLLLALLLELGHAPQPSNRCIAS